MNMSLFKSKTFYLIVSLIFLFIFIRSIHFQEFLNFSFDQGNGSIRSLELWKSKDLTLVGPGSSLIANHKPLLQGSVLYYFPLIFLLIGNFDPIKSSYAFMFFCALMIIPLYYGVKLLSNSKASLLVSIFYVFLPYYIDFTRFFYGPNFQLSLIPFLILSLGLYKKKQTVFYLFLIFFFSGFLTLFHYQFLLIAGILFIYFFWKSKKKLKYFFVSSLGFIIGFLPMIIFELKNNFYNIHILIEYFQLPKKQVISEYVPHRFLSISFILLILLSNKMKKFISYKLIYFLGLILIVIDLFIYLPKPKQAFGMAKNWNYLMEYKAYEIIKKENIRNFNIVNTAYDNLSMVIKYLMKKGGYVMNYEDYYNNGYLFIVSKTEDIFDDPAYEINTFKPNKKLKQWKLNDYYSLYLFERLKK